MPGIEMDIARGCIAPVTILHGKGAQGERGGLLQHYYAAGGKLDKLWLTRALWL